MLSNLKKKKESCKIKRGRTSMQTKTQQSQINFLCCKCIVIVVLLDFYFFIYMVIFIFVQIHINLYSFIFILQDVYQLGIERKQNYTLTVVECIYLYIGDVGLSRQYPHYANKNACHSSQALITWSMLKIFLTQGLRLLN